MKFLLIIAVFVGALWLLRGLRIQGGSSSHPMGEAKRPTEPPAPSQPVPMVSCTFCGLHLPSSEAFVSPDGERFCSESHRIEHVKNGSSDSPGSPGSPGSAQEHR